MTETVDQKVARLMEIASRLAIAVMKDPLAMCGVAYKQMEAEFRTELEPAAQAEPADPLQKLIDTCQELGLYDDRPAPPKPVAYREWATKFGGHWRYHEADDMPAGNYAMYRDLEPLYTTPPSPSMLLGKIAEHVEVMLATAVQHTDGESVTGYTIKTGALHQIIGLLTGNGYPVEVPLQK